MDRIKTRSMNELRNSTFTQDGQHWKVLEWIPKDMEYRCQSLNTGLVRRFTCDELLIAFMRESWEDDNHETAEAYADLYC